jgi:membrane associated rhomboid family serine protease
MALRIKFNSPVILGFAFLCTVIYIINSITAGALLPYFSVSHSINFSNPLSIATLFTHVLGHGSLEHLLGNMTFILLLGPIIEEKYGDFNTLAMIVVTALVTGLVNILLFNTGLLGASGVVFMLILLVSFTNVQSGQIPVTFILVAILFIGKELFSGIQANNISETAHIIGGVCGSIFGFRGGKAY